MPQDPQKLRAILDPIQVDSNVKAQAWDDAMGASSPDDFRSRFDKSPLPNSVKADIWDAKFGSPTSTNKSASPTAPAATTPRTPAPQSSVFMDRLSNTYLPEALAKANSVVQAPVKM